MRKKYCACEKKAESLGILFILCFFSGLVLMPQRLVQAEVRQPTSPEGLWKTIDDHTGEPRGLVRIYREGGAYFGRLEANLVPSEADARCSACKDERKDQPVVGMMILRGLKEAADGDGFDGGDVLDPESGSVYRCILRLEGEGRRLNVRGYVGLSLFGRSQTWLRAE